MLSFVDCVHAPRGGEEAALEALAASEPRAGEGLPPHRDPGSEGCASATGRGRAFSRRLLPRRTQPRAEQAKGRVVLAKVEPPASGSLTDCQRPLALSVTVPLSDVPATNTVALPDTVTVSESVPATDTATLSDAVTVSETVTLGMAREEGAQAGEGVLRGTLHAIFAAGGYAGALVLEVLQGVGSLHMGPMGTLPMASVTVTTTALDPRQGPHCETVPQPGNNNSFEAHHTARLEQGKCESKALGLGSENAKGVPGKGKGKPRVPLVPLSTVEEEGSFSVEGVPEERVGSPKRKSLEVLRSLFSHKVQALALAVA